MFFHWAAEPPLSSVMLAPNAHNSHRVGRVASAGLAVGAP